MTLGDILKQSAEKDLVGEGKNKLLYSEVVKDGKFQISLSSKFEEAYIECSAQETDNEGNKNYLRTYFLSMVFNAAVHGMKRLKHKKEKR